MSHTAKAGATKRVKKGLGVNFRYFAERGLNLNKILIWGPKLRM